ncbi:MAG TPA: class I mannose-6-phosphate isomerase [Acidisarcina sp.]|nr:class I mannose-6-phosphate isomerase [Acidisarcina sp.]
MPPEYQSSYDKHPFIPIGPAEDCATGWDQVADAIAAHTNTGILCVECYPGVSLDEIEQALQSHLRPRAIIRASDSYKSAAQLDAILHPVLGDDRVFGRMNSIEISDYFDPELLAQQQRAIRQIEGLVVVLGTGASLIATEPYTLVYADLARWEIQLRWRAGGLANLGLENYSDTIGNKYKCGYFVEWRAADRLKQSLLHRIDFLLDTNVANSPKLIAGDVFRRALHIAARRPFRVVPYFDPGPWGGHWMERVCDLPQDAPNHAWCFDCVPEENSLLLGFGQLRVEIPAIDVVFAEARPLLGEHVYRRFGAEFPIRFDFLDTMGGGNLSLQVHPLTEYIRDHFGMAYTQDESYYVLDADKDACVYLGLKEDADPDLFLSELRAAQNGQSSFSADSFVNAWPARKHDHFLIPAGTIHCSGKDVMVLEISATPYIFTFKLWDWNRTGLDGLPRPIHIDRGAANIQWNRRTNWVRENLIDRVTPLSSGPGWREESTGLHEREFIETRRHWFSQTVLHHTEDSVNVLNLVDGAEAIVESPTGAFSPFIVHYAETFIVPASVGAYTIRPCGKSEGQECVTIKASVRQYS